MWQIVVSIIKMTLQFLWEQVLHMVTATPCHLKVVHMNHQLHMETLLQMTKLTHLILLTQGRAQGKSIPTIRWRKGPYRDITTRASNPPSDTAQGCPKVHCMACKPRLQTLGCQEAPCVAETAGEHTFAQSDKQETGKNQSCAALSRRQNLHDTKTDSSRIHFFTPWCRQCFQKGFPLAWKGYPQYTLIPAPKHKRMCSENKVKGLGLLKCFCQNKELGNK